MPCILCGLNPPIQNSHMIPKFVFRRLKQGSPLNAFLHSGNVNRLIQDIEHPWKGPWLCGGCEALFSGWEGWFVNNVLDPFLRRRSRRSPYDQRLALFAASVHFRNLALQASLNPAQGKAADHALLANLRQMCLAAAPHHPDVFQYIQLLEPVRSIDTFPPGINTYLFEAVDPRVVQDVDGIPSSMSFLKLPSVLFVACDFDLDRAMPRPGLLDGHLIRPAGTLSVPAQSGALLSEASDMVIPKADEIQDNYSRMSARQVAKIREKIVNDPDRENRRAAKTFELDRYLLTQARLRDWWVPRFLWKPVATILRSVDWMPPAR